MGSAITVELDIIDVQVIAVALWDCRDEAGHRAWQHPNVERLRGKLSEAIREQDPACADTLERGSAW
jgi:hypothetical protein